MHLYTIVFSISCISITIILYFTTTKSDRHRKAAEILNNGFYKQVEDLVKIERFSNFNRGAKTRGFILEVYMRGNK